MSLMTLVAAGLLIQNTFTAFNVIQRKLNVIQKKKKKEKLSTVGAVCILKQKVQKIKYEVLNDNKSTFKLQFFFYTFIYKYIHSSIFKRLIQAFQ